jgi:hypothetical protein
VQTCTVCKITVTIGYMDFLLFAKTQCVKCFMTEWNGEGSLTGVAATAQCLSTGTELSLTLTLCCTEH